MERGEPEEKPKLVKGKRREECYSVEGVKENKK